MKIIYLAAGAAGMYCGSCLHDNTLAAALRKAGADVILMPTYTPLRTDEENVSERRVFFGGINVYLQQKLALFRHTPWFIDAIFNSAPVRAWLARRKGNFDAAQLGDFTVSMLQGLEGRQRKELEKLLAWLKEERPSIVHLSDALLMGMAGAIRCTLGVPVVCSLSGEDIFLDELREPYASQAQTLLRKLAPDAAAYVALNRYYADAMADYMAIEPTRVHVIPHGLNLEGFPTPLSVGSASPRVLRGDSSPLPPLYSGGAKGGSSPPFTIGYFARVCPAKGFHLLVAAFRDLCLDPELPPLRLRAAGYLGDGDRKYLQRQIDELKKVGLADRFEYLGEPDRAGKLAILRSFDVMSVPTVYRESKGLSILEALACGVPVVQPAHGSFPEIINDTGGGMLFAPENVPALAESLRKMVLNPALRAELGSRGQRVIHERYGAAQMARRTMELYRRVCGEVDSAGMAQSDRAEVAEA